MKRMLLAYVWCVDGREVRRGLNHKSLLDLSREWQVLQANLRMQMIPEMHTHIFRGLEKLSGQAGEKSWKLSLTTPALRPALIILAV